MAKLTTVERFEILSDLRHKVASQRDLAKKYGVTLRAIQKIVIAFQNEGRVERKKPPGRNRKMNAAAIEVQFW